MEAVQLGRSGLMVSEVCLGTMTFSREADKQTSFAIMDAYMEQGGFFVDTANVYSGGASEETVGAWMAERGNRAQIVLATKVFGEVGPGPNQSGLSRLHMVTELSPDAGWARIRSTTAPRTSRDCCENCGKPIPGRYSASACSSVNSSPEMGMRSQSGRLSSS